MRSAPPDPAAPPAGWTDDRTPLAELRAALRRFNGERDWGRYHSPRNLAMALSVEAGELLQLYLWSADGGPQPAVPARAPKVAEEAADVLICLLNLCEAADIDLAAAVEAKLRKNAEKYPVEAARGLMLKYDELDRRG
jgi:NTP pyrophosphatase (non-canonical NTP hydrolase)